MKFLRNNGLTIVLLIATGLSVAGLLNTGVVVHNRELAEHGKQTQTLLEYATSGHFLSALFENWESEFLQMSAYVVLTAYLYQKGSAESRDPDESDQVAADVSSGQALSSTRAGRMRAALYSHSLGIALLGLFLLSFLLHLRESTVAETVQSLSHGQRAPSVFSHLSSAQFWFESFQNWQSEFLSTAVIVVLSIFLRYKGSPESKPVEAPHDKTGA